VKNTHHPWTRDQVKGIDRRNHFMFEAFIPNAVKDDVGDVKLSYLDNTKGNRTDQDELNRPGVDPEKAREKPNRDQADKRPEEDLKEMKNSFLRNEPVF
jgi:hypothetical protein